MPQDHANSIPVPRASWGVRALTALALRWGRLWGGTVTVDDEFGLHVCAGMRGGFARGGTTVGTAYLTGTKTSRRVLRHEAVHVEQWTRYGLGFAFRYWWEEMRNPGVRNKFEIEAGLEDGGYRKSGGRPSRTPVHRDPLPSPDPPPSSLE